MNDMTTAECTEAVHEWDPLPAVWAELTDEFPGLHGVSANARYNFCQRHGAALLEAGILSRGKGRSWWVDRRRFKPAFRLLIAGRPLEDLREAGAQRRLP